MRGKEQEEDTFQSRKSPNSKPGERLKEKRSANGGEKRRSLHSSSSISGKKGLIKKQSKSSASKGGSQLGASVEE